MEKLAPGVRNRQYPRNDWR